MRSLAVLLLCFVAAVSALNVYVRPSEEIAGVEPCSLACVVMRALTLSRALLAVVFECAWLESLGFAGDPLAFCSAIATLGAPSHLVLSCPRCAFAADEEQCFFEDVSAACMLRMTRC
jgi:hypothetical protein